MFKGTYLSSLSASATCVVGRLFGLRDPGGAGLPELQLEVVAQGQIVSPVGIANAGDGSGRLFVVDQRGLVHILNDEDMVLPEPFLDIESRLVPERAGFDERGLLSIAFHPDFGTADAAGEGLCYVYYSAPSPDAPGTSEDPIDHRSVVAEYRVSADDPNRIDESTERVLLTIDQPQFNHDGGQLAFGSDGMLYISTGDGGGADDNRPGHTGGGIDRPVDALGNAQDTSKLLGKILRIDVFGTDGATGEYGIPSDNPFANSAGGEREEIFVYGLRNPWRFSFDDGAGGSGLLFCADVGQGKFEEVNILDTGPGGDAGGNLGWRIKEGTRLFENSSLVDPGGLIDPVAEYAHPGQGVDDLLEVGVSISGGHVYRGSEIPALVGTYVFGDWSSSFAAPGSGTLLGMEPDGLGGWEIAVFEVLGGNPVPYFLNAFGEDEEGEIYIAAKTTLAPSATDPVTDEPTGTIFRLRPLPPPVDVTLAPSKDNSLYEEFPTRSNGDGNHLFAGTTDASMNNSAQRRALLTFPIAASVPAGAVIESASLELRVTKTPIPPAGPGIFALHRLQNDWGEGTSSGSGQGGAATPGDATWSHAFFDTETWTTPGGDFEVAASATGDAGASLGNFVITGGGMVADVQHWLDAPDQNFGWILVGGPESKSARQFASRENPTVGNRPELAVRYLPGLPRSRREVWLDTFVLPGTFVADLDDLDGDSLVNLIEYALALDPDSRDSGAVVPGIRSGQSGFVFTFRRDPRAIDLTYRVETSAALGVWTVVAESAGGAVTSGSGFLAESPVGNEAPLVEVAVDVAGGGGATFVRLTVIRSP